MLIDMVQVALGIALLMLGGDALIKTALSVARRMNLSPVFSGLVLVGFGTSAPELAVSVDAALRSRPDIAVGNIVGSNIGNVLLLLGLCAMIGPLFAKRSVLGRDGIVVVAASALFIILAGGSALGRFDGVLLLGGLAAYLGWVYYRERGGQSLSELYQGEAKEVGVFSWPLWASSGVLVLSLAALLVGSRLLVNGASELARSMSISEAAIGLTVVAVGTSLPELTVSVLAVLRRHGDVAIGNILGSNIFNVLGILGISAILQPLPIVERVVLFDQWVMLGAAVLLLAMVWSGRPIGRRYGAVLLTLYAAYAVVSFSYFGH